MWGQRLLSGVPPPLEGSRPHSRGSGPGTPSRVFLKDRPGRDRIGLGSVRPRGMSGRTMGMNINKVFQWLTCTFILGGCSPVHHTYTHPSHKKGAPFPPPFLGVEGGSPGGGLGVHGRRYDTSAWGHAGDGGGDRAAPPSSRGGVNEPCQARGGWENQLRSAHIPLRGALETDAGPNTHQSVTSCNPLVAK